jgi:hypothetical protein
MCIAYILKLINFHYLFCKTLNILRRPKSIHSQALVVQDGPLASLSGFLDRTHTDTR